MKLNSKFGGDPRANILKRGLSGLKEKWSNLDDDKRDGISSTLEVISNNIQKFADAKDKPIEAIQGAIEILASIASNFGPKGQLASMGLGFVSALLGLFGKGAKSETTEELVRKQIDEALAKYRDHELTVNAQATTQALALAKGYLDGAASLGRQLNMDEVKLATSMIAPVRLGIEFTGRLYYEIIGMLDKDSIDDAHKCFKYTELYSKIVVIRLMILTQYLSMTAGMENIEANYRGVLGARSIMQKGAQILLEKLYKINFSAKILPYFDPDVNPATDSLARFMFGIGKHDGALSGYYCIQHGHVDMGWSRQQTAFTLSGNPYTALYETNSNDHCYWKIVPHGSNIYSIVNKYNCKKGHQFCGAMLSWDKNNQYQYVSIDHKDPVLWEINGNDYKR